MQRRRTAEDLGRTIDRIVVQERSAAFQLVLEVRQPAAARAVVGVVLAANRERDAVPRRHHDAGRPYLNVELDHTFADVCTVQLLFWRPDTGGQQICFRPGRVFYIAYGCRVG